MIVLCYRRPRESGGPGDAAQEPVAARFPLSRE
jgi:hypothetical protein